MTTLIIHPEITIQKTHAFSLASQLLNCELDPLIDTFPPDLHVIDGTLSSSIGIDDIRVFISMLRFHPYEAPLQIGLILVANTLTEQAQNALLKSLEEPPAQTRYILTASNKKFLLPTIISRSHMVFVPERISSIPQKKARKECPAGTCTAVEFLECNTVDKFIHIETLVAQEKDNPGALSDFLSDIIQKYRADLIEQTRRGNAADAQNTAADIRKITKALHYMRRNANKRLTLENLILQLENRIMQGRSFD